MRVCRDSMTSKFFQQGIGNFVHRLRIHLLTTTSTAAFPLCVVAQPYDGPCSASARCSCVFVENQLVVIAIHHPFSLLPETLFQRCIPRRTRGDDAIEGTRGVKHTPIFARELGPLSSLPRSAVCDVGHTPCFQRGLSPRSSLL